MLVFSTKKNTKSSSGGGLKLAVSIRTYILQNGGALSFSALYCIRFEVFLNFSSVFSRSVTRSVFSVLIQYVFPQNRLIRFIYDSFNPLFSYFLFLSISFGLLLSLCLLFVRFYLFRAGLSLLCSHFLILSPSLFLIFTSQNQI